MITLSNGQTVNDNFNQKWQTLPGDEFLYRYLLATTALRADDDGLQDEEQKVLKHFGITYWEPGLEEVNFKGNIYKVVNTNFNHETLRI